MSSEGSKVRSALLTAQRIGQSSGSISTRLLKPSNRLPAHRSDLHSSIIRRQMLTINIEDRTSQRGVPPKQLCFAGSMSAQGS